MGKGCLQVRVISTCKRESLLYIVLKQWKYNFSLKFPLCPIYSLLHFLVFPNLTRLNPNSGIHFPTVVSERGSRWEEGLSGKRRGSVNEDAENGFGKSWEFFHGTI